ncbi:hypothetical protein DdX_13206 [Ditylenchus destructor]|uniref:Uncharacterized protein n=1 Tax=Ditylenchus destructor TaxID=166010 RepID=A0AAD4R330_9BILA|nr:hypothetical protein DdX_13206 [Ditylenchus destructor]
MDTYSHQNGHLQPLCKEGADENATFVFNKLEQNHYSLTNSTCQKKRFILVYGINPDGNDEIGFIVGADSPTSDYKMVNFVDKIKNSEAYQLISSLISNIRIKAVGNIHVGLSGAIDQHCQVQINMSHVIDKYGLINDCVKILIEYQLEQLQLQTQINQSVDACEQRGMFGIVMVFKNVSAPDELSDILYQYALPKNASCQNMFVLVYSVATEKFGWTFGRDLRIRADELHNIVDKQINGSKIPLSISGVISIIQAGALENINKMLTSAEKWMGSFNIIVQIAVAIGLFGNIICILTILLTKLIQSSINKYLVVLLISDTIQYFDSSRSSTSRVAEFDCLRWILFTIGFSTRWQDKTNIKSTKLPESNSETLWILPTIYATLSTPNFIMFLVREFIFAGSLTYTMSVVQWLLTQLFTLDFVYNWFFYAMARLERDITTIDRTTQFLWNQRIQSDLCLFKYALY